MAPQLKDAQASWGWQREPAEKRSGIVEGGRGKSHEYVMISVSSRQVCAVGSNSIRCV